MVDDKTVIADPGNLTFINQPKRRRACLVQYNGASLGKRYILDEPTMLVGRIHPANIIINEPTVSKQHSRFQQVGDRLDIEDLGSSNGTFVNDVRVERRASLKDGDIIRLGNVLLKYFANDNIENVFVDKIYRMATIDAGTQIFNKKYLLEALDSEFKFSRTYGRPLSIIMFDLDFFKKVNDIYGHNAGDYILKECATLGKSAIRKEDILGRFGGEEFCIVLPNTDKKITYDLAERLRQTIEQQTFVFEGQQIQQTISLGVAQLNSSMKEAKDLLEEADRKLYNSKNSGRNRVSV